MSRLGPFSENAIVVGDCLDIMTQMPDGCVDLVVTDPPYGSSGKTHIGRKHADIVTTWDWDKFSTAWISSASRIVTSVGSIIIFMAKERGGELIRELARVNFHWKSFLAWHKTNPAPQFRKRNYLSSWEMIGWFVRDSKDFALNWTTQKDMHNFIEGPICMGNERLAHPTQKPEYLIADLLEKHSDPDNLIFDPFMGSGTTAVVADKLGRKFFGCDINLDYVEMALERLEKDRAERQLRLLM